LLKEIAQRNIAIVVQTTGHYGAIHQHAYLIAQGIAEDLLALVFLTFGIRPFKDAVIFQIDVIQQFIPIIALCPRSWYVGRHQLQQMLIGSIQSSQIP
jgi:hypothetical protein